MRADNSTLARLTRRQLSYLVALSPLAAQLPPSAPPASPSTSPPLAPSATPEQRLQKAIADVREISDHLSKMEVPMNVEPAFAFRA